MLGELLKLLVGRLLHQDRGGGGERVNDVSFKDRRELFHYIANHVVKIDVGEDLDGTGVEQHYHRVSTVGVIDTGHDPIRRKTGLAGGCCG